MRSGSHDSAHVGARIRKRRQALHKTLGEVSAEAGITIGYLSQLERGLATGSVAVLHKVCQAVRLSVRDLFLDEQSSATPVRRYADASRIDFGDRASKVMLTPSTFDQLQMMFCELGPGGNTGSEPYTHGASEETLLVVEGEVDATIGDVVYRLRQFDSVHYRSNEPHKVVEVTNVRPAKLVWGLAPPTY